MRCDKVTVVRCEWQNLGGGCEILSTSLLENFYKKMENQREENGSLEDF